MKKALTGAAVTGLVLITAACGSSGGSGSGSASGGSGSSQSSSALPGKGKPAIVLGDKNFDEEYLLGDIYADAFRAQGYTVDLKPNIGSSELINTVFQSGKINAFPEYLGEIVSTDAGDDKPIASEAQTEQLAQAYESKHAATVMTPVTPFFDTDELITLKTFAAKHHLSTVGDLKSAGSISLGSYSPDLTRYAGYVGEKSAYGLTNMKFVPLSAGAPIYDAVDSGQVQVGDAFSTDPQLLSGKYQVLQDTKNIFGFQHVGLVIKNSLLKEEGPQFQKTYAQVTDLLTTPVMQALNKAVALDQEDPNTVAQAFLKANHLLGS
jgi:osmoprotectant transport system substrate-binding protein